MSFKAMAWAAEQHPPTATAKLALLMMASMADRDTNRCWPSYQRLADDCMCSRRTIASTIKSLAEDGYITVANRFNEGGQTSNIYTLKLGRESVSANTARGVVSANNDTVSANMAHPPSDTVAHETVTLSKLSEKQSDICATKSQRTDAFKQFYQTYPLKKNPKKAEESWHKITGKMTHEELDTFTVSLITHTQQMKTYDADWLRGAIPHPTTYLNQERWLDEVISPTNELTEADKYALRQQRTSAIIQKINGGPVGHNEQALPSGVDQDEWGDWFEDVPRLG